MVRGYRVGTNNCEERRCRHALCAVHSAGRVVAKFCFCCEGNHEPVASPSRRRERRRRGCGSRRDDDRSPDLFERMRQPRPRQGAMHKCLPAGNCHPGAEHPYCVASRCVEAGLSIGGLRAPIRHAPVRAMSPIGTKRTSRLTSANVRYWVAKRTSHGRASFQCSSLSRFAAAPRLTQDDEVDAGAG